MAASMADTGTSSLDAASRSTTTSISGPGLSWSLLMSVMPGTPRSASASRRVHSRSRSMSSPSSTKLNPVPPDPPPPPRRSCADHKPVCNPAKGATAGRSRFSTSSLLTPRSA